MYLGTKDKNAYEKGKLKRYLTTVNYVMENTLRLMTVKRACKPLRDYIRQYDAFIEFMNMDLTEYVRSYEENEATLVKMRADATKDTYDVKRFEQVLSESQMMIPHSHASLQRNLRELQEMVAAHDGEIHSGGEALRLAMDVLEKETDRNGAEVGEATNVDDLKDGEAF